MNSKSIFALLIMASMVLSCRQPSQTSVLVAKDTVVNISKETIIKTESDSINNIARFIAGLSVPEESKISKLTSNKDWQLYSHKANSVWHQFDSVSQKYKDWAKKELPKGADTFKVLFYPFSGPDFLYANLFFPNAEEIYMFGLEDVGSVPDLNKINADSMPKVLNMYKQSISDVINISFFRTNDMKNELANANVDGTTPIMMLFLARSGKQVLDVKMMTLDEKGHLIYTKCKSKDSLVNRAVEITYKNPGEEKLRRIYYLTNNVADPALKRNKPYYLFFQNLKKNCAGYIKSATYLMHKPYFSVVRKAMLTKADLILQDDSGIAFRYFDSTKWDITLYGSYTKPIPLFEEFFEQDLFDAYQKKGIKKLPFRIGYHPKSDLLIAKRK